MDAIEHDPYVLISLLSAWHEGEWTLADVRPTLQMLFDRQYTLTENVVKERRYYIETDTWTDEDGNTHTDSYRVYYDYYICTVTLDNFNLSHLPIYIMGEDKVSRYSLYMATLGNRPDLFPGSSYVGKYTSPPEGYEVPGEYLDDETFAAMLSEAEKFLGYPYVWGGSSPATSFDCSGFVSWVVNHSGWNVGRLGAQGLYNICTRTSSPRPGDLVFFKGTYDTPGVSHCGIYVGDGMMLHCGDPIQYANLNSSYWQAHFYAYGRLP
ncbi:D-gamma-glutamyl-meso-diaminopimelic acid endopeptidase CwlS precursor [Acetatifactor muris]|uniref:D-gamma-glutamyl-meso-diaminopimelic acid endopeptidase CwlS n=1 Tax=Acetatifactor muris TaxID=879566 RepID=A0A2K4ZD75_9FIRM|nr:D-gamma-glutamyl-meso-diaminopimelic acid endopeptidase CwlS precursor [Acetatifactor muris]